MTPTILGRPSSSPRAESIPDSRSALTGTLSRQGGENKEPTPHLKNSPRGLGVSSGQTRRTVNPVPEQVTESAPSNRSWLAGSSPAPDTTRLLRATRDLPVPLHLAAGTLDIDEDTVVCTCDFGCDECSPEPTREWRRR